MHINVLVVAAIFLLAGNCATKALSNPVIEAGATLGNFDVDANGGATYSISFDAPPGTNGVSPNLSLKYSSQNSNGPLGVGWRLQGLSGITRCPRTLATDGIVGGVELNSNDRFCVDGERLIAVQGSYGDNGTIYHTQKNNFIRFTSHGSVPGGSGPQYFSAISKDGSTMKYGETSDSRVEAQGKSTVRVWAINRTTDRNGNFVTVTYIKDLINGTYRPDYIEYTGNTGLAPQREIRFTYESRNDIEIDYIAGSIIKTTTRLTGIRTYVDQDGDGRNRSESQNLVKTYNFSYAYGSATGLSTLITVQECGAGEVCLPATTFSYSNPERKQFEQRNGANLGKWLGTNAPEATIYMPIDVDGNGRTDLVAINKSGTSAIATYWRSNNDGFANGSRSTIGTWSDLNAANARRYLPMDTNGDGMLDIVELYQNGYATRAHSWLSTGSEFVSGPDSEIGGWTDVNAPDARRYLVMDVNDDRLPDIVELYKNGSNSTYAHAWVNTGNGFESGPNSYMGGWSDVNGHDTHGVYCEGWWIFQSCHSTSNYQAATDTRRYLAMDASGDGRTDIVELYKEGSSTNAKVWQSTSSGFVAGPNSYIGGWTDVNAPDARRYLPIDANADGLVDIVEVFQHSPTTTHAHSWLNTGAGFISGPDRNIGGWSDVNAPDARRYLPIDTNADGLTDIVEIYQQGAERTNAHSWLNSEQGFMNGPISYIGGWTDVNSSNARRYLPMDTNGDGLADIVEIFGYEGSALSTVWQNPMPRPDLLTNITNGLGGTVTVSYDALTDDSIYSKSTKKSANTQVNIQPPLYVVSQHITNDGRGNMYDFRYSYEGLKIDNLHGWLGFEKITIHDVAAQTEEITYYYQNFPLTGLANRTERQSALNKNLLGTDIRQFMSREESGVYTIYESAHETGYYSQGNLNYTQRTEYTYDSSKTQLIGVASLGNFETGPSNDTSDDVFTCYQYDLSGIAISNSVNWWKSYFPRAQKTFGHPQNCATVNFESWDTSEDLAFSQIFYDNNMNGVRKRKWNNSKGKWITRSSQHDQFGNVVSRTDPLGNTYIIDYDPLFHSFPSRVISPPAEGIKEWVWCGNEGEICNFSGTRMVRYGHDEFWYYQLATNSINCTNEVFGDPRVNWPKECLISTTDPTTAQTLTDTMTYEPKFGLQTSQVDADGLTQFFIPKNGISPMGRVTRMQNANESGDLEHAFERTYTREPAGGMKVQTWQRENWGTSGNWDPNNSDIWPWSSIYLDGLGRNYKSETKGPQPGINLEEEVVFDGQGRIWRESLPHFSNESPLYTTYEYDINDRLTKVVRPDGAIERLTYDTSSSRKVTWELPSPSDPAGGNKVAKSYGIADSQGRIVSTEAPDGRKIFYEYDRLGRRIKTTGPLATTSSGLSPTTLAQAINDVPNSQKTIFAYNSLSEVISAKNAELGTTTLSYNDAGQIQVSVDAKGQKQQFDYDSLGRITSKKFYNSDRTKESETLYRYDQVFKDIGRGYLTEISSNAIDYSFKYNGIGRVKNITTNINTDGDNFQTPFISEYSYDALGRTIEIIYPESSIVRYLYNNQGYVSAVQLREPEQNSFANVAVYTNYTSLGAYQNMRYANGVESTYSFDLYGRIKASQTNKKSLVLRKFQYDWNKANKLLRITDQRLNPSVNLSQRFSYNSTGRMIEAEGPYGTTSYTYDVGSNITQHNDTNYTYDATRKNQVISACDTTLQAPICTSMSYDANGNMVGKFSVPSFSGITRSEASSDNVLNEEYDAALKNTNKNLEILSGERKSVPIRDKREATIDNSARDNLRGIASVPSLTEVTYTYDTQDRLTQVTKGGVKSTFDYDPSGRRIRKTESATGTTTYYISDLFEVARFGSALQHTIYIYGPNGVITAKTSGIGASQDPNKDRASDNEINNPTSPMHGNGSAVVGQIRYFHKDHLGSTTLVTDPSGAETNRVVYAPFGELETAISTGANTFRPKFTGKEFDESTDLYYFGARYYDSDLGRFLTPDPDGQFTSPYVYAADDPIDHIDPDGKWSFGSVFGAITSSIGPVVNDVYNGLTHSVGYLGNKALGFLAPDLQQSLSTGNYGTASGFFTGFLKGTWDMGAGFYNSGMYSLTSGGPSSYLLFEVQNKLLGGPSIPTFTINSDETFGAGVAQFGSLFTPDGAGEEAGLARVGERIEETAGIRLEEHAGEDAAEQGAEACKLSFPAGTVVSTADGSRLIENIEVGEQVWSYDLSQKKVELRPVSKLFKRVVSAVIALTIGSTSVEATANHPFYLPMQQEWRLASELNIGDRTLGLDGRLTEITGKELRNRPVTVFNFEVSDNHNYFVGEAGVLVHNPAGCGKKNVGGKHGNTKKFSELKKVESDHFPPKSVYKGTKYDTNEDDMSARTLDYADHRALPTTGSSAAAKNLRAIMHTHMINGEFGKATEVNLEVYKSSKLLKTKAQKSATRAGLQHNYERGRLSKSDLAKLLKKYGL
ncbi:hypothetical protein MACH10_14120 [Thalassospira tepidiphila]|uniref:polymorphic toxin-type HINT domain-containing protein n=1 Tax=Thalassospira tepidiphila TaxID=393657 RepID=UPI002924D7C7|nr:hypothetical protein MACH10_14120 [Thalassospira tepidiphila]